MKAISHKDLTPTLSLTECKDGWWLYDSTRGMNLSIRAETAEAAFVEALGYYQNRLIKMENQLAALRSVVSGFTDKLMELDVDLIPNQPDSDY